MKNKLTFDCVCFSCSRFLYYICTCTTRVRLDAKHRRRWRRIWMRCSAVSMYRNTLLPIAIQFAYIMYGSFIKGKIIRIKEYWDGSWRRMCSCIHFHAHRTDNNEHGSHTRLGSVGNKYTIGINCIGFDCAESISSKCAAYGKANRTHTHTPCAMDTRRIFRIKRNIRYKWHISHGCAMPPSRVQPTRYGQQMRICYTNAECVCARPLPMLCCTLNHIQMCTFINFSWLPSVRRVHALFIWALPCALLLLFEHKYFILTDKLIKVDEHPSAVRCARRM